MTASTPPTAQLVRLLTDLFSEEELRYWVKSQPDGEQILLELPGRSAPLIEVAYRFVEMVTRRGTLDAAFFDRLLAHRPYRRADISSVAEQFLFPRPSIIEPPHARLSITAYLSKRWRTILVFSLGAIFTTALVLGETDPYSAARYSLLAPLAVTATALVWVEFSRRYQALARAIPPEPVTVAPVFERDPLTPPIRHRDRELVETTISFFARVLRKPQVRESNVLLVPEVALVAAHQPALPEDAHRLRELLQPSERAYFLHRGPLSERVIDILDDLRLEGHPIAPLSYEAMRAALDDDSAPKILAEIEHSYFRQQNLYEKRNALWDARFFFGRKALLDDVGGAIASGDGLLITGLRKSGKSSFLNILRQRMLGRPWCHIDLQSFAGEAGDRWPLAVARALIAAVDRWAESEFGGAWRQTTLPPMINLTDFAEAYAARRAWLTARGAVRCPVLVLDEVERVFSSTSPEVADRLVSAGVLRAAAQADGWLVILAADLHPVFVRTNILANGATNPFYDFLQVLPIGLFTHEDTARMLRSIGKPMGITEISNDFVDRLYAYTGGHPGFARTIAAAARTVQSAPQRLDADDLNRALNHLHLKNTLQSFFRENIWTPATPPERAVMDWLARQGGPATPSMAPPELRALEPWSTLTDQGVLGLHGEHYGFVMDGLRQWLVQQHAAPS